MSANNWRVCPKCIELKEEKHIEKMNELEKEYGKINSFNFIEKSKQIETEYKETLKETFCENYELGLYEKEFYVNYIGICTECKFEYKFKESIDLTEKIKKYKS